MGNVIPVAASKRFAYRLTRAAGERNQYALNFATEREASK
jgi:hypothetical protein